MSPLPEKPKSTLFNDPEQAVEIARDLAIDSASRGADRDWLTSALRGVRVLAARNMYLTSDDVWAWMRPLNLKTPDNRAMGAVMVSSARDKYIIPTKEWRISERSVCHGRPIRVWKSLRYPTT